MTPGVAQAIYKLLNKQVWAELRKAVDDSLQGQIWIATRKATQTCWHWYTLSTPEFWEEIL
jgi:hypothetical protein